MMPQAMTQGKLIRPWLARYPAGGITTSLGKGKNEDSRNIMAMMPQYPRAETALTIHVTILPRIDACMVLLCFYGTKGD